MFRHTSGNFQENVFAIHMVLLSFEITFRYFMNKVDVGPIIKLDINATNE